MSIQINNSVIFSPPANSNNTEIQKTTHATNKNAGEEKNANSDSDIKLSSRAHKVQMLNEEFFPNGPSSVTITSEFIQRLHEYGFITEAEVGKLNSRKPEHQQASGTLGELSKEIGSLSDRLKNDKPGDSLIDILTRADAIINNLDGSKPSSLARNIKMVSAELNSYLGSDDAKQLTDEEKKSVNELSLALTIADKLNPNNISSQKLNSYLSFA